MSSTKLFLVLSSTVSPSTISNLLKLRIDFQFLKMTSPKSCTFLNYERTSEMNCDNHETGVQLDSLWKSNCLKLMELLCFPVVWSVQWWFWPWIFLKNSWLTFKKFFMTPSGWRKMTSAMQNTVKILRTSFKISRLLKFTEVGRILYNLSKKVYLF